jgi:hypothetical protein
VHQLRATATIAHFKADRVTEDMNAEQQGTCCSAIEGDVFPYTSIRGQEWSKEVNQPCITRAGV